ncbi:MAG: 30S ribosomal protein S17 [Planctomycetes bacterium]|nr:30S ribosomal protein S17 [Planctomycetota bacterium]
MSPATTTKSTAKKTPAKQPDASVKGTQIGVVESDKRHQTRRVVVSFLAQHAKYGKYIRRRTVLHVHDEANESRTGDRVEVAPCRPISKTKFFRLVRVIERGAVDAA